MTTQLVPKRRFKGFKGSWKLVQVNEVAEFNPSSILPKKFYYVDLESVEEMKLKKASKEKLETAPSRAQRVARKGDIFYQTVRPYQRNNYLFNLSKRTYVFSTGYAQLRPSIDSSYLINQLITPRFSREVLNRCTGTGYPAISPYNLSTIAIKIPQDKRESQKIGEFFKLLDARIANQKRKIEKIKALKQAYLTEMFPQEGEDIPKRRFVSYSDVWYEYSIKDIFQVTRGNVLATEKISSKKNKVYSYPVYSSQTKNKGLLGYYDEYLYDTAITWTTDGANAGTVNFRKGKFYSTNVNGVLLSDAGYANKAVAEAINCIAWKYVSKVGNPKLMNNVMAEIKIKLPQSIEELDRLSSLFVLIDEKIEAEEKKLEKLKKMKAAFLEEMFV